MKFHPVIGRKYRWTGQPEVLAYLGLHKDHPHCRGWHQFEKVDEPGKVWCEVRPEDLAMLEEVPATEWGEA